MYICYISLSISIYIYICLYVYIHIEGERERFREREGERSYYRYSAVTGNGTQEGAGPRRTTVRNGA